jgi:predicted MFS family arabinose efflux permease
VALQWPVGWLADKVNERVLIFCCVGGAGLCLALLPLAVADIALRLPLCFVGGGLTMSLSTLGLVAVGRTYSGGLLAVMSTWFSVLYEVGATIGPVIAGMAMVRLGADGLPLTLALACAIVCILFLIGADRVRAITAPNGAAADGARLRPAP